MPREFEPLPDLVAPVDPPAPVPYPTNVWRPTVSEETTPLLVCELQTFPVFQGGWVPKGTQNLLTHMQDTLRARFPCKADYHPGTQYISANEKVYFARSFFMINLAHDTRVCVKRLL